VKHCCFSSLVIFSPDLAMTRNIAASCVSNFCKAKGKERGARDPSPRYKATKEQSMEYLILVAVVSIMALYALIIVGCLKQREW